jgi:hypothetical protein
MSSPMTVLVVVVVLAPGLVAARDTGDEEAAPERTEARELADAATARDDWFVGARLGPCAGVQQGGRSIGALSGIHPAGGFELGLTRSASLTYAVESIDCFASGTQQYGSVSLGTNASLLALHLAASWFPWRRGFFARAGAGAAMLGTQDWEELPDRVFVQRTAARYGFSAVVGFGYSRAWGRRMDLVLSGALYEQVYPSPSGSTSTAGVFFASIGVDFHLAARPTPRTR